MGGLSNEIPDGLVEVDVVIVGGGTAGCVVASRLSDADPSLSILVVERGRDNWNDPAVTNPLFFMQNILQLPEPNPRMMYYKGQAEPGIEDRAMVIPAGSILGGGSSISMLTYSRAQREDLDGWNMPGWSADEMLPYMKKFETYYGPGSRETHGIDGPIHISSGQYGPTRLQDQFIKAASSIGFPESVDLQDLDSNQAVQRNLRYISRDGIRQDAAHAYLHPRLQDGRHPNLGVLVEHDVEKLIIENGKVGGINIRANPSFQDETKVHQIKVNKMAVVCAGTIGTPLLLERSGIGNKEILTHSGIPVVADLPGVGEEFQDHNSLLLSYYTSFGPDETWDDLLNGSTTFQQLLKEESKILGWNGAEITSKVRPTEKEVDTFLETSARRLWNRDFKNIPNKPIATIPTANGFIAEIPEADKSERFLTTAPFLLYPYARGHVHVTGPNLEDEIDLVTGILADTEGFDLAMAMWLYKKQREIVRRLDIYRGEYAPFHPSFAADSDAACVRRDGPLPPNVEDIMYTAADDAVLMKWVRGSLAQNWHGTGTCKMGPQAKGGVVDQHLRVYNVESLKVADLSIVPVNLAANPQSMAFTIGEKAGDILASELKDDK
ncbi:alcohol oxidase [Thozetella sp. PMI_491]|nr:alcohol oxidase [Thozetella sp. PMI_491]